MALLGGPRKLQWIKCLLASTGLQKYGKYYLQVAAQSEDGLGPYSIPIEFRTLEDSKYL